MQHNNNHNANNKDNNKPKKARTRHDKSFTVDYCPYAPEKFTGKNTLFGRFRANYFLLSTRYEKLCVTTNHRKLSGFTFNSDRKNPTRNFIFNNFISGIFRFLNFHNRFSPESRAKYFKIVRRHMEIQYRAMYKRAQYTGKNNNQTKTFFRFSVEKSVYYFGFHEQCSSLDGCKIPPTFVSERAPFCLAHWKQLIQRPATPAPPKHVFVPLLNQPKPIRNKRLGITYTKKLSYSAKNDKYYNVYENLDCINQEYKLDDRRLLRFARLTRDPRSHNFAKMLTLDKDTVVVPCKHHPTPPVHHIPSHYNPLTHKLVPDSKPNPHRRY